MKVKKSRRWLWLPVLVTVIVVVIVVGRQIMDRRVQAAEPEEGQIVTTFVGDLSARASASGQLVPQREATLALGSAGRVAEVYVEAGDKVAAGEVLVQLEADALQRAVRSAEQALAIQEANLAELKEDAAPADIAAAEAAVASAQAQVALQAAETTLTSAELDNADALADSRIALESARIRLEQAQDKDIDAAVNVAYLRLTDAQRNRDDAQAAYDQAWDSARDWELYMTKPTGDPLFPGPSLHDQLESERDYTERNLAMARTNLGIAQAEYMQAISIRDSYTYDLQLLTQEVALAELRVERLERGVDPLLVPSSEAQLASARAQLAQAEANLAALRAGPSEERVAIAQAQLEQAMISLEEALDNLANASLAAPFDGVVTTVYVEVGEFASGPAVDLVDTGSMEVVLDVDEVDIGAVSVGQQAVITLETWPDKELAAEVVAIAPQATAAEIVTYQVHLGIEAGDLPLRAGMTANAELVTAQREGVLLVPNRAITADRSTGTYTVNRLEGDTVVEVEVTIGLRDNRYTEIRGGLAEGDQVIIGEYQEVLDFTQGPPSAVRNMR